MTVRVTQKVADQFEMVRQEGAVNMLDRIGVQIEANRLSCYDLVVWIEDNKGDYGKLIMQGFEIAEEGECMCVAEEAGVRAYEYADEQVRPIQTFRDTWDKSIPFEEHAKEWFDAAKHFREEVDPRMGMPDEDCPYCGGSGVTTHEDALRIAKVHAEHNH